MSESGSYFSMMHTPAWFPPNNSEVKASTLKIFSFIRNKLTAFPEILRNQIHIFVFICYETNPLDRTQIYI